VSLAKSKLKPKLKPKSGPSTSTAIAERFDQHYWQTNYSDPDTMDGIVNAKEHAAYLHNHFAIDAIEISSIADLGYGMGHQFLAFLKAFKPREALGIEPSGHVIKDAGKRLKKAPSRTTLHLQQTDLANWCQQPFEQDAMDLGICMSVFQYLPDKTIKQCLPILAQRFHYLYFTVPTNREYQRYKTLYDFEDPYAQQRTQGQYLKWLQPHFTVVSSRLLESRHFYSVRDSAFNDLLYRF